MRERAAQTWNRAVRYWTREARALKPGRARTRAWENALKAALRAPGWMVRHTGLVGVPVLIEIESVGPRGGIRGRRHYKTRGPGVPRYW